MSLSDKIDAYNIVSSFSDDPKYDFGIYAKGYRKAAKSLSDKFLLQSGFTDYEGYPIVFLYRHAFELNLKNIIYSGNRLLSFKNREVLNDGKLYIVHFLDKLAKLCTEILSVLFKNDLGLENVIKNIILIADEYTALDNNSFSYRYPIDIKGNYSTKKHQIINITSLTNSMENLLDSIEAINFGLDIETDQEKKIFEILSNFSDD
jgi:hypothetical protein